MSQKLVADLFGNKGWKPLNNYLFVTFLSYIFIAKNVSPPACIKIKSRKIKKNCYTCKREKAWEYDATNTNAPVFASGI